MTERPILFNAPMVRAILAGTKTQTRRVVKAAPEGWAPIGPEVFSPTVVDRHGDEQPGPDAYGAGNEDGSEWIRCPYGQPEDRLWVRETWARDDEDGALMYRADLGRDMNADAWEQGRIEGVPRCRWRPSIHMPRWASRIALEITGVRVERLQDISDADAKAEGCPGGHGAIKGYGYSATSVEHYRTLWEQINGPGSWDANPWVWVVGFRRVEGGAA
jgi:hypothetical protein